MKRIKKFLAKFILGTKIYIRIELLLPAFVIALAMYLFLPRYQLASIRYEDGSAALYMIDMRTKELTLCPEDQYGVTDDFCERKSRIR